MLVQSIVQVLTNSLHFRTYRELSVCYIGFGWCDGPIVRSSLGGQRPVSCLNWRWADIHISLD